MATQRLRLTVVAAAVVVVAAAASLVSWRYLFRSPIEPMVDLEVYQRAGDAVRHGRVLYEDGDTRLVFTYPPFAAVVAAVIAPMRGWWGQLLWTVATFAALVGVCALSFRPLLARCSRVWRPLAVAGIVAVAAVSHPVVEHVFYGQVNVFLVLLCASDLLARRRRWPQGLLVGLATALKLTPGVFIAHLWSTGRTRATLVSVGTAVAATAAAWLILPSASLDFWTREIYEGQRVAGSVTYTSNQSLLGFVARVIPGGAAAVVWLIVAVAVAWFGLARARAAHANGDELGAVGLTSLLAVLLSPIAWIHHLVWFLPVLGAIVADGRDRRRVVAAAAVTVVLLLRFPWWGWSLLDEGPIGSLVGVVLHNAYTLLVLVVLVAYPVGARPRDGTPVASAHGRAWRNRTDRALPARG